MATSCSRALAAGVQREFVQGRAVTSEVLLTRGRDNQTVAFFEGDQILDDDTRDLLGAQRWSPESHLAMLRPHTGDGPSLLLVMPTTLAPGGQACFGNFLGAMTAAGEPLGFRPQGFLAAAHLAAILAACGCGAGGGGGAGDKVGGDDSGGSGGGNCTTSQGRVGSGGSKHLAEWRGAPLTLIGFSKGAVVVNQLLAEVAWHEQELHGPAASRQAVAPAADLVRQAAGPHGRAHTAGRTAVASLARAVATTTTVAAAAVAENESAPTSMATTTRTGDGSDSGSLGTDAADPATAAGPRPPFQPPAEPPPIDGTVTAVLDSIRAVHFLDAGLNCRGVHLTDPAVVAQIGRRHRRLPLVVHLHGTPRQWGDRKRPWIAQERDRFLGLLREAGVPVHVHEYFAGQPPSLRQHFDVIAHMRGLADDLL